ncbi:MAG: hypothetical protein ABI547_10265 [Betaproteobacteria bacterium]
MNSSPRSSKPAAGKATPFTAVELERRLDESLDPVLSSLLTAQPLAERFASFAR